MGPYEPIDEIGRSATSVVFRARNIETGIEVALKVIPLELAPPEAVLRRLRDIAHPNVVRVLGTGQANRRAYIAMELVDGPSLERAIRRRAFGPLEYALITAAVARGLQSVHEAGLVHRDIKPGNILLTSNGTPKLSDLGLAELAAGDREPRPGLTAGTPAYMSPEQAAGINEAVGPSSDIYSLGVVLYEAVTGRLPFFGGDTLAILRRVQHEAPSPPRSIVPDLDEALEALILKALSKDPSRRPPTALAFAEALDGISRA
ncbi:MAG: serine/threonine protein kinase [Planctomycetes bacterium]|nr:serine/threonine protein kinase [Planctomycetota bacterium]